MILDGIVVEDNIYKSIENDDIMDMYVKNETEIKEEEQNIIIPTEEKENTTILFDEKE
jgi:hypothetical protein